MKKLPYLFCLCSSFTASAQQSVIWGTDYGTNTTPSLAPFTYRARVPVAVGTNGWLSTVAGAKDTISTAVVPVYDCGALGTTPTVSGNVYALSTNEFFSSPNGIGMVQTAFWQGGSPGPQASGTYTPSEIRVYLSSEPWTDLVLGTPWTNHFLVTGPKRVCPMITFSTFNASGTNTTLGVLSSSQSGLNFPVRATDGTKNLYGLWISAGAWTNAPTAKTNLFTLTGINDQ